MIGHDCLYCERCGVPMTESEALAVPVPPFCRACTPLSLAAWDRTVAAWRQWHDALGAGDPADAFWNAYDGLARALPPLVATPMSTACGFPL